MARFPRTRSHAKGSVGHCRVGRGSNPWDVSRFFRYGLSVMSLGARTVRKRTFESESSASVPFVCAHARSSESERCGGQK
eukprot:11893426-Alexandrium_andersonii.AAC.1